jgi:hypothetical protein
MGQAFSALKISNQSHKCDLSDEQVEEIRMETFRMSTFFTMSLQFCQNTVVTKYANKYMLSYSSSSRRNLSYEKEIC